MVDNYIITNFKRCFISLYDFILQLEIEADVGTPGAGDIAIDYVILATGSCGTYYNAVSLLFVLSDDAFVSFCSTNGIIIIMIE